MVLILYLSKSCFDQVIVRTIGSISKAGHETYGWTYEILYV